MSDEKTNCPSEDELIYSCPPPHYVSSNGSERLPLMQQTSQTDETELVQEQASSSKGNTNTWRRVLCRITPNFLRRSKSSAHPPPGTIPWRANLEDKCFSDTISLGSYPYPIPFLLDEPSGKIKAYDNTPCTRSIGGYTYERIIRLALDRSSPPRTDWGLTLSLTSRDGAWLSSLSRADAADIIGLNSAVRTFSQPWLKWNDLSKPTRPPPQSHQQSMRIFKVASSRCRGRPRVRDTTSTRPCLVWPPLHKRAALTLSRGHKVDSKSTFASCNTARWGRHNIANPTQTTKSRRHGVWKEHSSFSGRDMIMVMTSMPTLGLLRHGQ
ncbi:hypothetical protein QBC40DRAFT_302218 [Triangularia verruculosa]|uniref:Uncharacterized protein n=1 Tax=Triangularia verruculosa TaxID=2587418 RepID=A0AAN6XAJ9_9PEZI|nr:hypothetical protein QBC40DRAFT_302218 [Triangularia verruculosa]